MLKKLLIVALSTVLVITTTSCNKATEQTVNVSRELTVEEIAKVNKAFEPITEVEDKNIGSIINPLTQVCTSFYEKPQDMNLNYFLMYFNTENILKQNNDISDEEFKALQENPDFPFTNTQSLKEMPVPIHRKPLKEVNTFLQKYMNISVENLNTEGLVFLEKPYNAFYNFTSDAGFPFFTCTSGRIENDTVYLQSKRSRLTLKKEGTNYYIYSHTKNK